MFGVQISYKLAFIELSIQRILVSTEILGSRNVFNTFQPWLLKFSFAIRRINYILKCIQMEKLVFYCIFENSKNTVSLYSENKCNLGEHVYLKKSIDPKLLNAECIFAF